MPLLGLPTPSDLVATARSVLGWTDEAVQVTAGLPARVSALVDEAERLVVRVGATLDRVDAAIDRVDAVAARAAVVAEGAADVADGAGRAAVEAQVLLETVRPLTERAAPLVTHFLDEFSVQELHGLIRLLDTVPHFAEHMETDIMPVLAKLDQVGPDVHELLDVLKDVRLAIQGLPGFGLFRRRGAEREDDLVDDRPTTPPPVTRDAAPGS